MSQCDGSRLRQPTLFCEKTEFFPVPPWGGGQGDEQGGPVLQVCHHPGRPAGGEEADQGGQGPGGAEAGPPDGDGAPQGMGKATSALNCASPWKALPVANDTVDCRSEQVSLCLEEPTGRLGGQFVPTEHLSASSFVP